jgi:signal transduction histidine kinase
VFTIALIGLATLLFDKARSPGPSYRRALTPVTAVFTATVAWFVVSLYVLPAFPETASLVTIVNGVLGLAIPMAILLGLVWGDVYAARSVGQIVLSTGGRTLTPAAAEAMIAAALGDSTLTLGLWAPERNGYLDTHGTPLEVPRDTRARGVTEITGDRHPAAVLIHDPMLDTDSGLVEGLAATSLMLLENTRLVEELQASRSRIVDTANHERRRLERNLHDGAQQRLTAIQIKLRLAQEQAADQHLAARLEAIGLDAEEAVEELRRLAHGIYPPMLRECGLGKAFRDLAVNAPVQIDVADEGIGRCARSIESTIYFCSLEAIQNAIKHAGSHVRVAVTLKRDRSRVHFAVADDGAGIDPATRGTGDGLMSMRDRIGAIGGTLHITSSPGQGTTVHGTIPVAEAS